LQRYAIGSPWARRDLGGRRYDGVDEHPGRGTLPGRLQVVVQTAELQGPLDLAVHDLGADTAAAHHQALVDEGLDGLADRGPGQPEPPGELDLVAEKAARGQGPVLDRGLQLLGQLEVQRDRTAAVDTELERHGQILIWFRHAPSVAP
jgi:hypothetical protein